MRREHGLGALQVRVAGQDDVEVAVAAVDEGLLQVEQSRVDAVEGVADPEPQIGGDLIVAAAAGVQLAADIAQALDERLLDVHVDVFELGLERKFSRFDFFADGCQRFADLVALCVAEQADLGQHLGMGDRAGDVVRVEAMVEADAFGEAFDAAIGAVGKDAAAGRTGQW